jgi:hypothetical protein
MAMADLIADEITKPGAWDPAATSVQVLRRAHQAGRVGKKLRTNKIT